MGFAQSTSQGLLIYVAAVAQLVECVLGKDEVTGSIPVSSFFGVARGNGEVLWRVSGLWWAGRVLMDAGKIGSHREVDPKNLTFR